MAVHKRRIQIPEEAVEGYAGENDKVDFVGYTLGICCEKEVEVPNKNNTETKVEDSKEPIEVFDPENAVGMTISAKAGGKSAIRESKNEGIDR